TSTKKIKVDQMARSMDALTEILARTPEEFRSSLDGVSALSRTISSRDAELGELFDRTSSISGLLAERNEEITSILGNGSLLFAELERRREVIHELLGNVQAATEQMSGIVEENKTSLKPALTELRGVAQMLDDYSGTLEY